MEETRCNRIERVEETPEGTRVWVSTGKRHDAAGQETEELVDAMESALNWIGENAHKIARGGYLRVELNGDGKATMVYGKDAPSAEIGAPEDARP